MTEADTDLADNARKKLQNQMMTVLSDEVRAAVSRYVNIYGMHETTSMWALYAAQLTVIERMAPAAQLSHMIHLSNAMFKRVQALRGDKPGAPEPAPAAQPDPVVAELETQTAKPEAA